MRLEENQNTGRSMEEAELAARRREMKRRRDLRLKKILIIGMVMGAVAGVAVTGIASGIKSGMTKKQYEKKLEQANTDLKTAKTEAAEAMARLEKLEKRASAEILASSEADWSLALVNSGHPLDRSYAPAQTVEVVQGQQVDARIQEDTSQMLQAAQAAGMNLYICSAYRNYDTQWSVFNETMVSWMNQGYNPLDAYEETKKSVAVPGTSEHATGLALDITSATYTELNEQQAETEEAKWLAQHCWEYGFILRYPPEKSNITGIIYEPWHYRYVGKEAAKEIMEKGITLEEYLEQ